MDRKKIGAKILELRTQKGWSQNKLATKAGVSSGYLPEIERGLKCPTVEVLDNICFALGISPGEFFDESSKISNNRDYIKELSPIQKQLLNDFLNSL